MLRSTNKSASVVVSQLVTMVSGLDDYVTYHVTSLHPLVSGYLSRPPSLLFPLLGLHSG